jgi:hypothetical protein
MTLMKIASVAVLAGFALSLAAPAEAAPKRKKSYIYYGQQDRQVVRTRSGTRIVVTRRSFLNPGTETKQHDQHYSDYAFPPGYSAVGIDRNDPKTSFNRMPFNDPFDGPGPKY